MERRRLLRKSKQQHSRRLTASIKKALSSPSSVRNDAYKQTDYKVFTRGTKWSQLHGVGRSSLHGSY